MALIKTVKLHKNIRKDILALIRKSLPEGGTAEVTLAIAAQVVGQILALQDQRTHTAAEMIELIQANIELGNQQYVAQLMAADGLQAPHFIN